MIAAPLMKKTNLNYIAVAQLPEDVLDPMDQMELGTRTMFTPPRVSQSRITEMINVDECHTLVPSGCPD